MKIASCIPNLSVLTHILHFCSSLGPLAFYGHSFLFSQLDLGSLVASPLRYLIFSVWLCISIICVKVRASKPGLVLGLLADSSNGPQYL